MTPVTYFRSYPEPFYSDWRSEPVPGWGVRPVMAGPRMVAVGSSFGAAPQGIDLMPVLGDLAKLLDAEKNPPAASADPNGTWRKRVRERIVSVGVKYTGKEASALAQGVSLYVKNKYGVTLDLSADVAEAAKRSNVARAFKAAQESERARAEAEAAAKAAADEAAAMTAAMTGAKPVYKETWFLVAAGVAAAGVAYLLVTKP